MTNKLTIFLKENGKEIVIENFTNIYVPNEEGGYPVQPIRFHELRFADQSQYLFAGDKKRVIVRGEEIQCVSLETIG